MKRPNLERMTTEQRIKYLEDTDHRVVKWVNRLVRPDGKTMYHRDELPHLTSRLSEATIYDMKFFAERITGYVLTSITKKELFEAKLKGT